MNNQVESFTKKRQRWRQLRPKKGSRKGYNADIDDFGACSSCSSDEEVNSTSSTTSSSSSSGTRGVPFYSHVSPRHRGRPKKPHKRSLDRTQHPSCGHPDIDLSLVSLLSSKELDRRFGESSRSMTDSPSSSEVNNDSSSDSTSSQLNSNIIKNERKFPSTTARPLAVVDYGSIELDMSGSLLDSIYKIGGQGRSRPKDFFMGGRRYSSNNEANGCGMNYHNKSVDLGHARVNRTMEKTGQPTSILDQSNSVPRRRRSEVVSVIATLKNKSTGKQAPQEGPECKKRKRVKSSAVKEVGFPAVDKAPTSLEAAISFSPFARVLFCAQAPYTIVHTNAAYSALVQQGLAKPCIVGDTFSSDEHNGVESSEEHISRIVANHMGSLEQEEDRSMKGTLGQSRKMKYGFVHIFPVMSSDDCYYCMNHNSYQKHELLCQQKDGCKDADFISRRSKGDTVSYCHGLTSSAKHGLSSSCPQYRSHYLLQIEPGAQLPT